MPILLILVILFQDRMQVIPTESVSPLQLQNQAVAITPDGTILVLDKENARVVGYSLSGEVLMEFGRPGQGTGDLDHPIALFLFHDKIYIRESDHISVFSTSGTFIAKHASPYAFAEIWPSHEGWLVKSSPIMPRSDGMVTLSWYNPDFTIEKILDQWQEEVPGRTLNTRYDMSFAGTIGDDLFYLRKPGSPLVIDVYDQNKLKVLAQLKVEADKVPFDPQAAQREREEAVKRQMERFGIKPKQRPKGYPEYLPSASLVSVDGLGRIVASVPTGWRTHQVIGLDPRTGQRSAPLGGSEYGRVVARYRDYGFVVVKTEADEFCSLVPIPLDQVEAFIKDNPASDEFDWLKAQLDETKRNLSNK